MSQPYDVPLFGDPDQPKAQRVQSHKEKDDAANRIVWTRYRVSGVQCVDCILEREKGLRDGIGAATWLRVKGEDKRVLCYHHKADAMFRDRE